MLRNISGVNQRVAWDGLAFNVKPQGLFDVQKSFGVADKDLLVMEDKIMSNHRGIFDRVETASTAPAKPDKYKDKPEE